MRELITAHRTFYIAWELEMLGEDRVIVYDGELENVVVLGVLRNFYNGSFVEFTSSPGSVVYL